MNGYPTWGNRQWKNNPAFTIEQGAAWWKENLAKLHTKYPEKPVLIAEFGYPAIAGVHDGGVSEQEQATVIEAELAAILSQPFVAGATIWCWADHPWAEDDWIRHLTTAPFGVVTRDRTAKVALPTVNRIFHRTASGPSLQLRRPNLKNLPELALPDGYTLRSAGEDDAEGLAACLQTAFPEMTWTSENASNWLLNDPTVQTTFVIEQGGQIVATASARLLPDDFPNAGYIHWVGANPAHRGKRLGYFVSLATLHDFVRLNCQEGRATHR